MPLPGRPLGCLLVPCDMINALKYRPQKRMSMYMAESVIQPTQASDTSIIERRDTDIEETEPTAPSAPTSTIIWTPPFIVTFALVLVLGLSTEGLLTQGKVNHVYAGHWVLLAHVLLILGCWVMIVVRAHSWWVRTGGIFACIWALFTGFRLTLYFYSVDPTSLLITHVNTATASALLGTCICLSLDHTPLHRWDAWFFRLALVVGSCAVALAYFLTSVENRSLSVLERDIAITALVLCILVWWARPSCWKTQPGPTFILGISSAILLLLPFLNRADSSTNFFLSQVAFLCILLGALRILQAQRQMKAART
jgi:hypothetical protein